MATITTSIALMILFFTSARGQDELLPRHVKVELLPRHVKVEPVATKAEIVKVTENIERVFHSQSGQLLLDLKQIPESVAKRLEFLHDSIESYWSKAAQETFNRFNDSVKSEKFIANRFDTWRATDVILEENRNLPSRKFLLAVSYENEMVFAYWHGGIGIHLHMYYIELDNVDKLTGFVTSNNSETFLKYQRKNKLDKVRTTELTKLVDLEDLRVFKGKVIDPLDEF